MVHRIYRAIAEAVRSGTLHEPFSNRDFESTVPGFAKGTYSTFLAKHVRHNPGGQSELFDRIARGRFRCLRPFRYGL